jgi:hypothetical protein
MLGRSALWTTILGFAAVGMFLAECVLFHFPFASGLDVLFLTWVTALIGVSLVLVIQYYSALELKPPEILSLGCAVGFGVVPVVSGLLHWVGVGKIAPQSAIMSIMVFIGVTVPFNLIRKYGVGFDKQLRTFKVVWIFAIGALLLFAAYNLQQFHYAADGSIVTHGLFGVDIPFLAGEVHGIRDFGTLRDLHQMGQQWQYHDWTYQLLALLPRDRTVPDLAFAAPLVGYVMLALSIYTLSLRLTSSKLISYAAVALWFLVSGLEGGELSSYALSPSFVFGSMISLNILLVFDLRVKGKERQTQWVFSAILLFLLIVLSQTKLSSFLVLCAGIGVIGLIKFWKERNIGITLLLVSILSFVLVLWQNRAANPMMPSNDFLIGAPLLGYANHIASMLHVPVSEINPISHGFALHWQSVFIIPFFIFHFLRFALVDPKILSAIIAIVFLRKLLWYESKEIIWLLLIILPVGFLLPVLYSPAWYPLALSFYAPLMSMQAALLLVVVGFVVFLKNKVTRSPKIGMGLVGLICLIGVAIQVHSMIKEESVKPSIISASFVHAMNYLQTHAKDTDIIATRRFDLDTACDESYYWYSALSGRRVISEGAKYGSLLGAVADTNAEKGLHPVLVAEDLLGNRRNLLDTIYRSRDSSHISSAIAESGVTYILEDSSSPTSRMAGDSMFIAHHVFSEGGYWILKVREVPAIELLE